MNKKILIMGVFTILMIVTISYASAFDSKTSIEKNESPLYRVRAKIAIGEKINTVLENIKTKFLGERIFFIPNEWFKFKIIRQSKPDTDFFKSCNYPITECPTLNICQAELRTYYTVCGKPRLTCDLCEE
jgi:hypothetical protein